MLVQIYEGCKAMNTAQRIASRQKRKYAADPASIYKLMNKLQPFTPAELVALELPIRVSFEALRTGHGTERDWSDLAAAINVTIIRSRAIDPLCEQTANAASDALVRMWHRAQSTGRWGFDGPGISDVELGIDLHEQLCRLSTPAQMLDAMRQVLAIRESNQPQERRAA